MKPTCIIKDCGKAQVSRGLCLSCYAAAKILVDGDKTTWEFLEKNNLSLPTKKRSMCAFLREYVQLKK